MRRPPICRRIAVEPPRDASHGDLATNAAMVLAKPLGLKPRELAEQIAARCARDPDVAGVEVAGPGFVNLRLGDRFWQPRSPRSCRGRRRLRPLGARRRAQGQCRIRLGQPDRADACRPLPRRGRRRCAGQPARVRRLRRSPSEYYINDAGAQVDVLARSAYPALPRGAGREIGDDPGGALSRRLSDAGRRGAGRGVRRRAAARCRKTSGCRSCASARSTP